MLTAQLLDNVLGQLARRIKGVVGVNFLMPFLDPECLAVAARKARVVEFFYGDPDAELVRQAAAHGALVGWQVGSASEALAAERAGCAYVVAQGTEAGGHVRGQDSVLALIPQVIDAVRVPVVAAGGIGSAADMAAMLAFGAGAVRLGTRFAAATESGAHRSYKEALIAASADDTCLTEKFSVMWPNAPHRVLRAAIRAAERIDKDPLGEIRIGGQTTPVPRFSVIAPTTETTGHVEAMALYAGESVVDVRRIEPAGRIIAELSRDAERLLGRSG
jgi:NAD(P)H-dependent flavin oxidoreductase YrpB (nitropropane dioxygenase family)